MKQVWSSLSRSIPDPCRGPETHLSHHPRICVTMKLVAARCQKIFMDVVISIVLSRLGLEIYKMFVIVQSVRN